jgi:hypothetical protein
VGRLLALVAVILCGSASAALAEKPVVAAVHGIGFGNRQDGWSRDVAKQWNVGEVEEITFRYRGREWGQSFVDFASRGGDWAIQVRDRLREIARRNPERPLVLVTHSWGTVVAKLALMGGMAGGESRELAAEDYEIRPAAEVQVAEWITLASPLGRAHQSDVAVNLRQLHLYVPEGRPANVLRWTNFYDTDDSVSLSSQKLEGARNVAVRGSGSWIDPTGISAHTGIWVNREVRRHVQRTVDRLWLGPDPAPPMLATPSGRSVSEGGLLGVKGGPFEDGSP